MYIDASVEMKPIAMHFCDHAWLYSHVIIKIIAIPLICEVSLGWLALNYVY